MSVSELTQIRFDHLEESHLDGILEIEAEAYPEPWTRGMFRDEIHNHRSMFLVATFGDEMVGYAGYWLVLDEAHITTVVVRDSYRGRGVGRQLFKHLIEVARMAGANMATLEVRTSNKPARELYSSFNFRPVGIRKGYYPKTKEDAIVMLKEFDGGRP
jgi:ribosomal-protein-alanine N-acetyltransferase